jgi:hypothetical protein
MTDDTYKGESPGKKSARFAFWSRVREVLGEERFVRGPHVVLASREMGDFSTLRGLGCSAVVGAEISKDAYELARAKNPEADVRLGDVVDVARGVGSFASCLLDFCSPICRGVTDTASSVLRIMSPGSVFGIAVLKGREQRGKDLDDVKYNRATRRGLARSARAIESEDSSEAVSMANYLRVLARLGEKTTANESVRATAAMFSSDGGVVTSRARSVMEFIDHERRLSAEYTSIEYHSRTPTEQGVPMLILAWTVGRPDHRPLERRRGGVGPARQYAHGQAKPSSFGLACGPKLVQAPIVIDTCSMRELRDEVLSAEARGLDASMIFNLPRATVAAWKAHATRGTYDKGEAAE